MIAGTVARGGRLPCLGGLVVALGACHPGLTLTVQVPAEHWLPEGVERLAVADRSASSRPVQAVLDVLGALGGTEAPWAEDVARAAAVTEAEAGLRAGRRHTAVRLADAGSGADDGPLAGAALAHACDGVDGVLALDALDADLVVVEEPIEVDETDDAGRTSSVRRYVATRTTTVDLTWRLYACGSGALLDERRDARTASATGEPARTPAQARAALTPPGPEIEALARESAAWLTARYAPSWVGVRRSWYASGHSMLEAASQAAKRGEWPRAEAAWREAAASADPRVRGRALVGLAVAAEVRGQVDAAVGLAEEAAALLRDSRSRALAAALVQRQAELARLRAQLGQAAPR